MCGRVCDPRFLFTWPNSRSLAEQGLAFLSIDWTMQLRFANNINDLAPSCTHFGNVISANIMEWCASHTHDHVKHHFVHCVAYFVKSTWGISYIFLKIICLFVRPAYCPVCLVSVFFRRQFVRADLFGQITSRVRKLCVPFPFFVPQSRPSLFASGISYLCVPWGAQAAYVATVQDGLGALGV